MVATAAGLRASGSVPAVERATAILVALGDGERDATLTALAQRLRIHKSTAHNILETLAHRGFVTRDAATKKYRLGPALAALAHAAVAPPDLRALARPYLVRLQRLSGETVTLHARDGAGSVILASEESSHELKVSARPGHRLLPTAGAVAKVLLAFGAERASRLSEQLPSFTPRTIVSRAQYLNELRRVRLVGVAYDEMEYLPGVRAISVPVFAGPRAEAEAIAALSIVGVAARVSHADLRRFAGPLRRAAHALAMALHPQPRLAPAARGRTIGLNGRRRRPA